MRLRVDVNQDEVLVECQDEQVHTRVEDSLRIAARVSERSIAENSLKVPTRK